MPEQRQQRNPARVRNSRNWQVYPSCQRIADVNQYAGGQTQKECVSWLHPESPFPILARPRNEGNMPD